MSAATLRKVEPAACSQPARDLSEFIGVYRSPERAVFARHENALATGEISHLRQSSRLTARPGQLFHGCL